MLSIENQIIEQLKKSHNILIVLPKDRNGDNIASALALLLTLRKMDKSADILLESISENQKLAFLPQFQEIKPSLPGLQKFIISLDITRTQVENIKYNTENDKLNFIIVPKSGSFTEHDVSAYAGDFKYDLIVTLGAFELDQMGAIYENNTEFFFKTNLINIDNSPHNQEFGQINHVQLTANSIAEIIFGIIKAYPQDLFDEEICTCLLAGMIIKTRNFKSPTMTPQSLEIAAQLITKGGRREEIANELYRSKSINSLKLWGRALARLSGSMDNKLIWSVLNKNDFVKTESSEKDLSEIIEELIINIPQATVVVLAYEHEISGGLKTKIVVHTLKNVDLSPILKKYSPLVDKRYSYITTDAPLQDAIKQIIIEVEAELKKLPI